MTLVEVLVAVGVLSVGILGLISTFIYGTQATKHGVLMSEANNHARQLVAQIRINNFPFSTTPVTGLVDASPSDRTPLAAAPFQSGGGAEVTGGTDFTRNISISYNADNDLATITVRVYWFERGSERNVELIALQGAP